MPHVGYDLRKVDVETNKRGCMDPAGTVRGLERECLAIQYPVDYHRIVSIRGLDKSRSPWPAAKVRTVKKRDKKVNANRY
jgi:hypothetical protein